MLCACSDSPLPSAQRGTVPRPFWKGHVVNKADLIEAVTKRIGDKRTANAAVEAFIDAVTRAVATGERVAITGFGVFEKVDRAARTARNPATGAVVQLKKTSVPKFRAGQGVRDVVSGAKELAAAPVEFVMARTAVAAAAPAKRGTTAKATAKKTAKKAAKKTTAKKTAKKAAKKTTAKKAAKKTTTKKGAKKTTASKKTERNTAKKNKAKKTAKKTTAGKTTAKKTATNTPAAKTTAKKAATKTTARKAAKKTTARKTTAKKTAKKAAKKTTAKRTAKKAAKKTTA